MSIIGGRIICQIVEYFWNSSKLANFQRKKAHPELKKHVYAPNGRNTKYSRKITEKQVIEETIKKQKREEKITKANKNGIPE